VYKDIQCDIYTTNIEYLKNLCNIIDNNLEKLKESSSTDCRKLLNEDGNDIKYDDILIVSSSGAWITVEDILKE
jgi:hypothetical protein